MCISSNLHCLHIMHLLAHLRLLEIAYEKNTDENPVAAMWRYRSQITIEHLQLFMDQPKYETQCPILKEFLNQVNILLFSIIFVNKLK